MTAIVGVLNKRAVAIAADSAMTVKKDGQTKIYNSARKIFKISDSIPVGIMLSGNMDFMDAPWDVIMGQYRKYRDGRPLPHLKDYTDDFRTFLKTAEFLNNKETYRLYILSEMGNFYYRIKAEADKYMESYKNGIIVYDYQCATRDALADAVIQYKDDGVSEEMKGLSLQSFLKSTKDEFGLLKELMMEESVPTGNFKDWKKAFYEYMVSNCFVDESELVFVGYGENEIFPAIQSVTVTGVVGGRLRSREGVYGEITNTNDAMVFPFAQDDVMITLLKGISPSLFAHMSTLQEDSVEKARERIIDSLKEEGLSPEIVEKVKAISFEDIGTGFCDKSLSFIQENYIDGLNAAVDCFSIREMADMAENLISVTGLQRHYTSLEESVGGPVNVAVITKEDGFRWVKTSSETVCIGNTAISGTTSGSE